MTEVSLISRFSLLTVRLLVLWWVLRGCGCVLEGLVCVYCAREGGACGVAPIPLECAPNLYWPLPDIELLPFVLSFEFILECQLAL